MEKDSTSNEINTKCYPASSQQCSVARKWSAFEGSSWCPWAGRELGPCHRIWRCCTPSSGHRIDCRRQATRCPSRKPPDGDTGVEATARRLSAWSPCRTMTTNANIHRTIIQQWIHKRQKKMVKNFLTKQKYFLKLSDTKICRVFLW